MLGFLLCGNISTVEKMGLSGQDENGACEYRMDIFGGLRRGDGCRKSQPKNLRLAYDYFASIFLRDKPSALRQVALPFKLAPPI